MAGYFASLSAGVTLVATVTVDIEVVGLYFRGSVTFDNAKPKTVLELMRQLEQESGKGSDEPVFRFMSTTDGSVRTIAIEHRKSPISGQTKDAGGVPKPFPTKLTPGFYEYTEKAPDNVNQVVAWQYYIMKPTTAGAFETVSADRKIEPAGKTSYAWTNGMKILWRGVLICADVTTPFGKGGTEYTS
jgi:hypothetical protein